MPQTFVTSDGIVYNIKKKSKINIIFLIAIEKGKIEKLFI
jgi:hypothetical protein